MLSSAETIDVIAETLQAHKLPPIVLDPVNHQPEISCPMNTEDQLGYGIYQWITAAA